MSSGSCLVGADYRLTLSTNADLADDLRIANFPPPGFKRTDMVTSVALVARFTR